MLRIAVCDDEEKQLNQAAALVNSYLQSHLHLHGQVETFRSGSELLMRAESGGGFDLYVTGHPDAGAEWNRYWPTSASAG